MSEELERENNITVLCIENKDVEKTFSLLSTNQITHYTIESFFDVEKFRTLEEVEIWWELK